MRYLCMVCDKRFNETSNLLKYHLLGQEQYCKDLKGYAAQIALQISCISEKELCGDKKWTICVLRGKDNLKSLSPLQNYHHTGHRKRPSLNY